MDTRQKVLLVRRFVVLPNGQQATVLPKTKPISGFVCSICNLGFKTKQGLLGHTTSTLHKGRILPETAVSVVTSGNVATLLLATSSSVTEPADASTPVESLGASSSTSSPASIPTAAGLREAKKTRRQKHLHVKVNRPEGAFYLFPEVSWYFGKSDGTTTIKDARELCLWLLDQAHVAITPGGAFGAPNYMRLSYATSEDKITEAVKRIKGALSKLK
jgi:hypothetical protein